MEEGRKEGKKEGKEDQFRVRTVVLSGGPHGQLREGENKREEKLQRTVGRRGRECRRLFVFVLVFVASSQY